LGYVRFVSTSTAYSLHNVVALDLWGERGQFYETDRTFLVKIIASASTPHTFGRDSFGKLLDSAA